MAPLSISRLKHMVAAFPETPERTTALEHRLRIGTGFHGKWYRSQRDHWLGWLVVQECQARSSGKDPSTHPARAVWQRLNCSPMMFWLAEVAGVRATELDLAEEAAIEAQAINPKDGAPHGTKMRERLPWEIVEAALLKQRGECVCNARELALDSFFRLLAKNSGYRNLVEYLS